MRPEIVNTLNQAFHTTIFEWLVPTSSAIYSIALMVGLLVFMHRSRQASITRYHAAGAILYAMLGGLVGTRLVYLLFHAQEVLRNPAELISLTGGTVSWGVYLGGLVGFWLYFHFNHLVDPATGGRALSHQEKEVRLRVLDAVAISLALGIGIGRWACFLNGDDFGKLSSLPWAVCFPAGSYPYQAHLQAGWLTPGEQFSLPVHPVQLYLSLNGFFIFLILSLLYPRLKYQPGLTFGVFWLLYGGSRFLLEFFRADYPPVLWNLFTPAQIVCVSVIGIAIGWSIWRQTLFANH